MGVKNIMVCLSKNFSIGLYIEYLVLPRIGSEWEAIGVMLLEWVCGLVRGSMSLVSGFEF